MDFPFPSNLIVHNYCNLRVARVIRGASHVNSSAILSKETVPAHFPLDELGTAGLL